MNDRTTNIGSSEKSVTINNINYDTVIFDTAGEEKYRALTKSFYRNSNGVIFVFDLCNISSFNRIESWIREILECNDSSLEMLLCGNKTDLSEKEVKEDDIQKLIQKYNIAYFPVSAKEDINIDESYNCLIENIINKNKINNTTKNPPIRKKSLKVSESFINLNSKNHKRDKDGNCC